MPSAIKYLPPTDSLRDAFSSELLTEKMARRARYLDGLALYNGEHPDQLDYDPDLEPNDNTVINLVAITADRTASFLFPAVPRFQIDPNAVEETPEEKWVRKLIEENGGLVFLNRLVLRGFLAGHTFVRVHPAEARGSHKMLPRFVLLDPLSVTVFWNADDVGDVLWYENRYRVGEDVYIQDYVSKPDKGEEGEWEIYTYKAEKAIITYLQSTGNDVHGAGSNPRTDVIDYIAGSSFKLVKTDLGEDFAVHASPISPIIEYEHLPHPDDRYGHGEVTQKDLQNTINRVWSEINRIVRKHSDPKDVITGADVSEVEEGDDVMVVSKEGAQVQRLEMKGDLTAAVNTVSKLVETYLAVARVVLLKGEAKDLQRVTNASVRTLFIDALAKNEILRQSYGSALVKMIRLAMQMSRETFAPKARDLEIVCKWSEALPVDKTEIANINAIMVNLGARSKRTAATDLGDNWAFEQAAIETETVAALEKQVTQMEAMAKFAPPTAPDGGPNGKPGDKPKPGAQIKKTA